MKGLSETARDGVPLDRYPFAEILFECASTASG